MKKWEEVKNLFYSLAIKLHKTNPNMEVDALVNEAWITMRIRLDRSFNWLQKEIRYHMLQYIRQNKTIGISIDEDNENINHNIPAYGVFINDDFKKIEIIDLSIIELRNMILNNDIRIYRVMRNMGLSTKKIGLLFRISSATVNKYLKQVA